MVSDTTIKEKEAGLLCKLCLLVYRVAVGILCKISGSKYSLFYFEYITKKIKIRVDAYKVDYSIVGFNDPAYFQT